MKVLISILILFSFLQSSILPTDLVLLVLVLRSYINPEKNNLYLAFLFGLLISHLSTTPLGLQSLVYILIVQLTRVLSRVNVTSNVFTIIPLTLVALVINNIVSSLMMQSSIQLWPKVLIESIIALPIYILIRFWEERFVVRPEIRLKL